MNFTYIGICDFPNKGQVLETLEFFRTLSAFPKLIDFKVMVGVMLSRSTMMGEESKWTKVWPRKEDIHSIFTAHPSGYNTIHYADYENRTSLSHLLMAVGCGGEHLQALQLDMVWPDPNMIYSLKERFPWLDIILQINRDALKRSNNEPSRVVEMLKAYKGSVDAVLLDKSHGKGEPMKAHVLLPFAREIFDSLPHIALAAAGGLGPDTIDLVEPLVREFPQLSIDAQGKLRLSGSSMDPIDWAMAHAYLKKAVEMFCRCEKGYLR